MLPMQMTKGFLKRNPHTFAAGTGWRGAILFLVSSGPPDGASKRSLFLSRVSREQNVAATPAPPAVCLASTATNQRRCTTGV